MSMSQKSFQTFPSSFSLSLIEDFRKAVLKGKSQRSQYLAQHMLSKYSDPCPNLARARVDAAISKWLSVEERNFRTNQRLMLHDNGDNRLSGRTFDSFIQSASRIVKSIIGNRPPNLLLNGGFSGGASTSKRRQAGMIERKYVGTQHVTRQAWPHMWNCLQQAPLWGDYSCHSAMPHYTDHSVLFTVPKNDTIDRVACKEPDYNMYLQKGVGDFFRSRLRKRAHIDLNNQQVNRDLAERAWKDGLATVDLSSASDSVTTQLICRLLPTEWFVYLQEIRVSKVHIRSRRIFHEMEMFSTMGNGFTFELESLVFYALSKVIVDHCSPGGIVSVYGDDIVIPNSAFKPLKVLFNYCGFTVNVDKSFFTGPIRESCGRHYHEGSECTPIYLKSPIRELPELILFLNKVRYWSSRYGSSAWCDSLLEPFWRKYAKFVPLRLHGTAEHDSACTLVSPKGSGYRILPRTKPVKSGFLEFGRYIHWQHTASTRRQQTESTSSIRLTTEKWCVKPPLFCARDFGLRIPLFSSEVTGTNT